MLSTRFLAALLCVAPALAQNYYIPNNDPTLGTCNVIPFGDPSVTSTWSNQKYQTRCTVADLGAAVNIITGLGFAACSSGPAHYNTLEVVIDHIPSTQAFSTTFASNLTPNAVTVLSATNYTWNVTANAWNEIGLQTFFVYNGVDDIVVQITTSGATAPAGFHRDVRQRLYWVSTMGPPAATGTLGNAAGKIEVSMLTGKTSSHGVGCLGSNGTPTLTMSGSAVAGNTVAFNLTNGVPFGVALFFAGFTNAAPFPLELSFLGAPNCYMFTDLSVSAAVLLDPAGAASFPVPIPLALVGFLFYGQFAVLDPPANPFGFTTSGYGRVHTGN
jgi:hypothetical protein